MDGVWPEPISITQRVQGWPTLIIAVHVNFYILSWLLSHKKRSDHLVPPYGRNDMVGTWLCIIASPPLVLTPICLCTTPPVYYTETMVTTTVAGWYSVPCVLPVDTLTSNHRTSPYITSGLRSLHTAVRNKTRGIIWNHYIVFYRNDGEWILGDGVMDVISIDWL